MPANPDETFCLACDSLLKPATTAEATPVEATAASAPKLDPVSGVSRPRYTTPTPGLSPDPAGPTPILSDEADSTVACWSCAASNTAERSFCLKCGVWLDTNGGGRSKPAPARVTVIDPTEGAPPFTAAKWLEPPKANRPALFASVIVLVAIGILGIGYGASTLQQAPAEIASSNGSEEGSQTATTIVAEPLPTEESGQVISGEFEEFTPEELEAILERTPLPLSGAVVEPSRGSIAEPKPAAATQAPRATPKPRAEAVPETPRPQRGNTTNAGPRVDSGSSGWACDGNLQIEDPGGGSWRVTKLGFQNVGQGERVILNLERVGQKSGKPTSAIARASQGARGGKIVTVQLDDGFRNTFSLRRYRPNGLQIVNEVSVNPGSDSSRVTIAHSGDGCFRLVSPVWRSGGSQSTAQIYVDVRP
jgi:hypothetical protein